MGPTRGSKAPFARSFWVTFCASSRPARPGRDSASRVLPGEPPLRGALEGRADAAVAGAAMLGGGFVAVDGAVFWARRSNISITLREVWKRQYLHRALFS